MKTLVVLVFIFTCSFAQNLLQNPGFETWTSGMPDYWQKDDSIYIFQEDVIVHSGNLSVKDSLITQTQTSADFSQGYFAVQPNIQYNFSIWIYDNDPAGRVRQGIYWYPSGSSWGTDYSVDSTEWQQLIFTVTSPSDAESALVVIRAYDVATQWDGDAIFYIDDAVFEAPSTQPPVIIRTWHTPTNPGAGVLIDVYAYVTDDGTITADTLFYGINGLSSPIAMSHTSVTDDTFKFQIPAQNQGDTIFYYLRFIDDDGLDAISDTHTFFVGEIGVYINEVLYDTEGGDSACYIELYGTGGLNLDGFSLVGVNGYNGSEYVDIDLSGCSIPADGFFVIGQDSTVSNHDLVTSDADLQNGPDNLELRFNSITIDALGYGTLDGWVFTGEWLPASDVPYNHCLGRYPDGYDTDDNSADFHDYTVYTPGEPNPPVGISEEKSNVCPPCRFTNPLSASITFISLVSEQRFYPITVYNILGQRVKKVSAPGARLALEPGVYFLKLNKTADGSIKIIVIE